ncbi:MAG: CPBP family intramembrane metalloprotease [Deltaproteobacteria bacterium]|nr:CPBP family intramembrane metalloprotease [Deltaproteobacteria bacterium]
MLGPALRRVAQVVSRHTPVLSGTLPALNVPPFTPSSFIRAVSRAGQWLKEPTVLRTVLLGNLTLPAAIALHEAGWDHEVSVYSASEAAEINKDLKDTFNGESMVGAWVGLVAGIALINFLLEEVPFRFGILGVGTRLIKRSWAPPVLNIVQALLFSAFHLTNPWESVVSLTQKGLVGFLFGRLFLANSLSGPRSLRTAVLRSWSAHFLLNLSVFASDALFWDDLLG